MEKEDGISSNHYTAEYWMYNSRLGRRWNEDPITYPWHGGYTCFNNNPISDVDPLGLWPLKKWFSRAGSKASWQAKKTHPNKGTRTRQGANDRKDSDTKDSRPAESKTSRVLERQEYYKEIWSKPEIDEVSIAWIKLPSGDSYGTDVDASDLKERSDRDEVRLMEFDYSRYKFEHYEGSGYSPVKTRIKIPRRDGRGEFVIEISDNLSSVEVKQYVQENSAYMESSISREYKRVLKGYKAAKEKQSQVIPYSEEYSEWIQVGEKQTPHGKDLKNRKVKVHVIK